MWHFRQQRKQLIQFNSWKTLRRWNLFHLSEMDRVFVAHYEVIKIWRKKKLLQFHLDTTHDTIQQSTTLNAWWDSFHVPSYPESKVVVSHDKMQFNLRTSQVPRSMWNIQQKNDIFHILLFINLSESSRFSLFMIGRKKCKLIDYMFVELLIDTIRWCVDDEFVKYMFGCLVSN